MADITITAANFLPSANAIYLSTINLAGEAIVAGETVYLKDSDSKFWKTTGNASEGSTCAGFAANTAAAGQRLNIVSRDSACAVGTVLGAAGKVFGISAAATGKICDIADINGDGGVYVLTAGTSVSTSTIRFDFTQRLPGLLA